MLTFTTQEDAVYYMEQSGYTLDKAKGIMRNTCGSTVRVAKGKVEWVTKSRTKGCLKDW